MKTIQFHPIDEELAVKTESTLLEALTAKNLKVLMACGGKGLCATCHIHIREGADKVSPRTEREKRTLSMVSMADSASRLACQCRVLGEGIIVELPSGMFIERSEDLLDLLGKRAETDILHPITAEVLIREGKIITRSRIEELKTLNMQVDEVRAED